MKRQEEHRRVPGLSGHAHGLSGQAMEPFVELPVVHAVCFGEPFLAEPCGVRGEEIFPSRELALTALWQMVADFPLRPPADGIIRTDSNLQRCVMSEFKGVTVVKKANVYFDGKVTSRTIIFDDGSKKTLGIMLPGEYEFSTGAKELMEILSGELEVLLPGETSWKTVRGGEAFEAAANAKFTLKIKTLTDYCCSFLP
jgi:uncharacterized protein YaiE (UPF0345 family)